jgi:hypothetical protein
MFGPLIFEKGRATVRKTSPAALMRAMRGGEEMCGGGLARKKSNRSHTGAASVARSPEVT